MAFINILEIVYPIGSIYISTANVSPAETIGGSWTQIQGATLGFTGSNGFAASMAYGGSLKISTNQMPPHGHQVVVETDSGKFEDFNVGIQYVTTSSRLSNQYLAYETGGGQNFLPYHFSVYGWYRVA